MSLAGYRLRGQPQQKIRPEHLDRAAVVYLLSELGGEFSQFRGGSWCAGLRSFVMIGQDEPRDLSALVVPQAGWLEHAEDPWEPYRLLDPAGALVGPVAAFLRDLQACGRPETTLRVCDRVVALVPVLVGGRVPRDQATRAEARVILSPASGRGSDLRGCVEVTVLDAAAAVFRFFA